MDKKKKQEESIIMEYFINKYDEISGGKLIPHESPDFILKTGKKNHIGIELTQIHQPIEESRFTRADWIEKTVHSIEKKNDKINLYNKNRLREVWLIIYCDSLDLPSNTNFQKQISRVTFTSNFNQIFLFDLFSGKIFELPLGVD